MARFRQDVRYALRTFGKAPAFTAIAVFVLAVGIGANTAMFSIVNELLLRPLSGRAGELVGLYSRDRTRPDSYRLFSYPNYAEIRDSGLFEALLAQTFTRVGTQDAQGDRQLMAAVVSSNYFDALGVRLAAGRPFTPEEEHPGARVAVTIASYPRWQRANFDPAFVGSTIRINSAEYTVVGVAPEGFTGTMALLSADVYLPLGMFDAVVNDRFKNDGRGLGHRGTEGLTLSGRLTPGQNATAIQARLEALSGRLAADYPVENGNQVLSVAPLSRLSLGAQPQGNAPLTAFGALLIALSGTVLIIACLNIANMLLARGTSRRRELAVRLALGAGRARVVRQLLTESLLLAAAGATFGLALSYWAARTLAVSLTTVLPVSLPLGTVPDVRVLLATIAFASAGTLAFGLGPALKLSRRDLIADLKDRGGAGAGTRRRINARNLMVVGQAALSLAMITAGGLFARPAIEAASRTPGYWYERLSLASLNTLLAGLDETRGRLAYSEVLTRVRSLPGVTAASLASNIPFSDSVDTRAVERADVAAPAAVRARGYRIIGADHFATLGLPMVRGREFTAAEEASASAPRVAIIDEALGRQLFGAQDPIGQTIRFARAAGEAEVAAGERMEIVGLAPPLREELLDRAPVAHIYVPFGRHYRAAMHLLTRHAPGANEADALDALRREIRTVSTQLPVLTLSTMQAFHDRGLELWALRAGAGLFAGLGVLALLLAAIGVYGVRSYTVEQRTREIGIRMALGATSRDVRRLMLREGALLTTAGIAIGLPLAFLVSLVFRSVFVEIGGLDWLVLTAATVTLTVAAMFAGAVPARRAAKVQPVTALRAD